MKSRFIYMKFLGLLLVLVGFSYSLTSFNNFFAYIFDTKIFVENLNIYLMVIGLIFPLAVFIYGIYFYFYSDFNITKINKGLFALNVFFVSISVLMIIFNNIGKFSNFSIVHMFEFVHFSFAYCLLLLSSMGLYGCIKYRF